MFQTERRATDFPRAAALTGADVHEDHGFFVLRAEFQGLDGAHLGVSVEAGDLVFCGKSEGIGFYRRLPLPFEADGSPLGVQFDHGHLEVRIPIPESREEPIRH